MTGLANTTTQPTATRARDLWARLWRVAAGPVAWLWLAPALLGALLSFALPQMPASVLGDAAAQEVWLAGMRAQLGPAADTLARAGLLSIEATPVYRVLLALRLFSALLALYEACARLRAAWSRPEVEQPDSYFAESGAASAGSTSEAPAAALDALRARLRRAGYRTRRARGAAAEYLAADRVLGLAARVAGQAGLLVLVLGLWWTAAAGWRGTLLLTEGQSGALAGGANASADSLRLEAFESAGARVALNRDGQDVARVFVPAGTSWWQPAGASEVLVRLNGGGPGLRVSGEDNHGQPLQLQGCPGCDPARTVTLVLGPDTPERSAFVPAQSLVLVAERAPGGEDAVRVSVLAGSSEQPIAAATLSAAGSLAVDTATFHVTPVRYAQIEVHRAPGLALAAGGVVFAGLGALLSILFPPRRVWALAAVEGGATVVKVRRDGLTA